jgi:hypothetical protein
MPHIRTQQIVDDALRMSDDGVTDREKAEIYGVAIKTIRDGTLVRYRKEIYGLCIVNDARYTNDIDALMEAVRPVAGRQTSPDAPSIRR